MSKTFDAYENLLEIALDQLADEIGDTAIKERVVTWGWQASTQAALPTERARKLYREATALAESLYDLHGGLKWENE